jgi:hypothetical protein
VAGVASSYRPLSSNVGAVTDASRSITDQSRNVPITWKSLGPFMVPYTVGSCSSARNVAASSAGTGSVRHTNRE